MRSFIIKVIFFTVYFICFLLYTFKVIKMPKRKAKKTTKKIVDPVIEEKLKLLDDLKNNVDVSFQEYETFLLGLIEEKCAKVKKLYAEKLKLVPEHMRNMTIVQIMEQQEKEICVASSSKKEDALRKKEDAIIESGKLMSAKKKTLRKEKKRSLSVNSSARPLPIARPPTNNFSRLSRTVSESALSTPLRSNRLSNMVVTPKFNPKYPVSAMARIPKPDEMVMSLSGSPLQNVVKEGKVTLSLGGGKVLQIGEDTDLEKELEGMNEPTTIKTLKNLKEKLDKMLLA